MVTNDFFDRFNGLWHNNHCGDLGTLIISEYDFENMEVLFWDLPLLDDIKKTITVTMLTKKHILNMKLSNTTVNVERYRRSDCINVEKSLIRDKNLEGYLNNYKMIDIHVNFLKGKEMIVPYPHHANLPEKQEFEKFIAILESSL